MTDEIALGLARRVAFVEHRHGAADDHTPVIDNLDKFVVFQDGFNLADAPFHVALVVFGGVIVAIFFEVAHLACPADAGCNFDSPAGGEVKVFCL